MKNIFRKTVQKVRETAAKVSRIVKEHPEVAVLGVAAAVTGVVYAWAAYDSRKTINWLNSAAETENSCAIPLYNVKTVLDAVQSAYDAVDEGHDIEPKAESVNIAKYGFTHAAAQVLGEIGLALGVGENHVGSVNMVHIIDDDDNPMVHMHADWTEPTDA